MQSKPAEFSDLVTRYIADFVGRQWLVEQINALLDDPDCRFVVLTGGLGVGKTAFLAYLVAIHSQWLRQFIQQVTGEVASLSTAHARNGYDK